jgi:hypothetical protein
VFAGATGRAESDDVQAALAWCSPRAADAFAAEQLAHLFGQRVTVAGTAFFRPSGSLLRIEADSIELAGAEAAVWARVPAPLFHGVDAPSLRQPQGIRSGVNAIGGWPADETEEELASALREPS